MPIVNLDRRADYIYLRKMGKKGAAFSNPRTMLTSGGTVSTLATPLRQSIRRTSRAFTLEAATFDPKIDNTGNVDRPRSSLDNTPIAQDDL